MRADEESRKTSAKDLRVEARVASDDQLCVEQKIFGRYPAVADMQLVPQVEILLGEHGLLFR